MADGFTGSTTPLGATAATVGGTAAGTQMATQPQQGACVIYDGQNAGVQQQRSVQSMVAAAGVKRGANWFYWIAGLSLINTIAALAGGSFHFVIGLGITEITDAFQAPQARVVGFFIDFLVLGFFVMCGSYAGKLHKWAFVMGMAFYVLDAGIMLLAKDWLALGFHVYALFYIWKGFSLIKLAQPATQAAVLTAS